MIFHVAVTCDASRMPVYSSLPKYGEEKLSEGASYLAARELSERWGMSLSTLYRMSRRGAGPPRFLVRGRIMYRLNDVEYWEEIDRDAIICRRQHAKHD